MRNQSSVNANSSFFRYIMNCSISLALVLACTYTCCFASANPQSASGLVKLSKQIGTGPKAVGARAHRAAFDSAATFQILHQFAGTDGVHPIGGLALGSNGEIYGTTIGAGNDPPGTLFRLRGTALTTLANLPNPYGSVIADSDGNLYGSTINGGSGGVSGTVFRWDADTGLSAIHAFATNGGGAQPYGGLVRGADGTLYGTTFYTTARG